MHLIQNYPLNPKLSIPTEVKKTHIVWHASSARTKYTPYGKLPGKSTSIVDTWNNSCEKQGAPYIIDRDGSIYKTFEDNRWSYHLNIPATKGVYDKQSIAIVLANELNLIKENNNFYAFDYPHSTNTYLGKVVNLKWKGYDHWARLDEEQVVSSLELTKLLCSKYEIKPIFYIGKEWNPKIWEKATIFPHSIVKKEALDFPPFEDWIIDKIKTAGLETIS